MQTNASNSHFWEDFILEQSLGVQLLILTCPLIKHQQFTTATAFTRTPSLRLCTKLFIF